MKLRVTLMGLLALPMLLMGQAVAAPSLLPGPYTAKLIKVIDADTLRTMVEVWPYEYKRVDVRISGVDTPEKRGTGCKAQYGGKASSVPVHIKALENELGVQATDFVKALAQPEDALILTEVELGKYAGRIVGKLSLPDGRDLGTLLIEEGHAVPYDGGTKAAPWCADP